jgi:hypothetical protein
MKKYENIRQYTGKMTQNPCKKSTFSYIFVKNANKNIQKYMKIYKNIRKIRLYVAIKWPYTVVYC